MRVDAGDDFELRIFHDGWSSSETGKQQGGLVLTGRADKTVMGPLIGLL